MNRFLVSIVALFALAGGAPAVAQDGEAFAKDKGCLACHATDKKIVGPSYKDVAGRYGKGSVDALAAKILKGSVGVWGLVPMPANTGVKPDEAKKLATWILSLQ
ncbi:MAG: c-type cytochrome [Burkholderiaceae bacterium]|jgi:cytochrome c|nr:c-type cytochrome [Burkholderiaceae bacterium]